MIKCLFDIIFSLLGLVITSPLLLLVAVLIKVNSPGPVFYLSKRIGRNGKPFKMYKFRSMVVEADKIGGPSTAANDSRLTKIGKSLKKYQLDELPQLINVLKGEMSFVGPRPEVPFYVNMFTEEERRVILSVKPGLTDFASLWNFHEGEILRGSPDPEQTYMQEIRPKKLELQKKYVREQSLGTDIKIILKTISKIFK